MDELYKLKETLCKEMEKYGKKGSLNMSDLDTVDKLAHTVKNLDKIIEADGGSYAMYPYGRGRGSYARRRYSREGYSRHDLTEELRDLMDEAPDEQTRMEMQRLVDRLESR